jgi:hypothetical protein
MKSTPVNINIINDSTLTHITELFMKRKENVLFCHILLDEVYFIQHYVMKFASDLRNYHFCKGSQN